jgi:hypothetical protein
MNKPYKGQNNILKNSVWMIEFSHCLEYGEKVFMTEKNNEYHRRFGACDSA